MLTANPLIPLLDPDEHNPDSYDRIWDAYARPTPYQYMHGVRTARLFPAFAALIETVTGDAVVRCNDCATVVLESETEDYHGNPVCESCQEDYYSCEDCGCTVHMDDSRYLDGLERSVCESCYEQYYWCEHCETYNTSGGCEGCDEGTDCNCCAPRRTFRFPANGAGTVANDERMTLTLPKGIISEEGITAITEAVQNALPTKKAEQDAHAAYTAIYDQSLRDAWWAASDAHHAATEVAAPAIESVGTEWQTKRGNYPKRLGSALYKVGVKLDPATISEIGNLARQYSDEQSEYHIEFTRDLNRPADYFYNEDSCWWKSREYNYSSNRCAFKNWGGVAMRTFQEADDDHDDPSGRVFVFPLNADLEPTQDAETAHAYMVFNAYGALGGYSSARIVAHLAGMSYRKVTFRLGIQNGYVNSDAGYLVASAETLKDAPTEFSFSGDIHRVAP